MFTLKEVNKVRTMYYLKFLYLNAIINISN